MNKFFLSFLLVLSSICLLAQEEGKLWRNRSVMMWAVKNSDGFNITLTNSQNCPSILEYSLSSTSSLSTIKSRVLLMSDTINFEVQGEFVLSFRNSTYCEFSDTSWEAVSSYLLVHNVNATAVDFGEVDQYLDCSRIKKFLLPSLIKSDSVASRSVPTSPFIPRVKVCRQVAYVPITFCIDKMEDVKSIELEFYQGDRPIMGDILRPEYFLQGCITHEYQFFLESRTDITLSRRVYSHDGSWKEYLDTLKLPVWNNPLIKVLP